MIFWKDYCQIISLGKPTKKNTFSKSDLECIKDNNGFGNKKKLEFGQEPPTVG